MAMCDNRAMAMTILLNGEPREVDEGVRLGGLLEQLALRPEQVAVEVNEALVPRAQRDELVLSAGDRVELVTLVGGG